MADPALDLAQAKQLMDALYEPGDSFYICSYHDRDSWALSLATSG